MVLRSRFRGFVPKNTARRCNPLQDLVLGQLARDMAAACTIECFISTHCQCLMVTVARAVPFGKAARAIGLVLHRLSAQVVQGVQVEDIIRAIGGGLSVKERTGPRIVLGKDLEASRNIAIRRQGKGIPRNAAKMVGQCTHPGCGKEYLFFQRSGPLLRLAEGSDEPLCFRRGSILPTAHLIRGFHLDLLWLGIAANELDGIRQERDLIGGYCDPNAIFEICFVEASNGVQDMPAGAFTQCGRPVLVLDLRQSIEGKTYPPLQIGDSPIDLPIIQHSVGGRAGLYRDIQLPCPFLGIIHGAGQGFPVHRRLATPMKGEFEGRNAFLDRIGADVIDALFGDFFRHGPGRGFARRGIAVRAPKVAGRGKEQGNSRRAGGTFKNRDGRFFRSGIQDFQAAKELNGCGICLGRFRWFSLLEVSEKIYQGAIGDEGGFSERCVDKIAVDINGYIEQFGGKPWDTLDCNH